MLVKKLGFFYAKVFVVAVPWTYIMWLQNNPVKYLAIKTETDQHTTFWLWPDAFISLLFIAIQNHNLLVNELIQETPTYIFSLHFQSGLSLKKLNIIAYLFFWLNSILFSWVHSFWSWCILVSLYFHLVSGYHLLVQQTGHRTWNYNIDEHKFIFFVETKHVIIGCI